MTPLSPATVILLIVFIALPIGDVIATWFFLRLFLRSQRNPPPTPGTAKQANRPRLWGGPRLFSGRSWLLAMMSGAWAIITVVYLVIGWLALRRLLGQPPAPEGAVIIAIGLIALGCIPIAFAIAFHLTRRRGGRGGPPPFSASD